MVKFGQGIFLSKEPYMKDSKKEGPIIQTSSLNEELGQVDIIFSDKTGTLTLNQMSFNKISVNGIAYGASPFILEQTEKKKFKNAYVHFSDDSFKKIIDNPNDPQFSFIKDSLIGISLCHSVIVDTKGEYKGSSTDELALISFSKEYGVEFKGETADEYYILDVFGQEKV